MANELVPELPIQPASDPEHEELARLLESTRDCPTVPALYQAFLLQQASPAIIEHVEKCRHCQRFVDRLKQKNTIAHPVEKELQLYRSGKLSGEPLRRVEYHVHSLQCGQCAKTLASVHTGRHRRLIRTSLAVAAGLFVIIGLQWETRFVPRGGLQDVSDYGVHVIADRQDKPILELVAPEPAHAVVVVTNVSAGTKRFDKEYHLRAKETVQIPVELTKEASEYVVLFVPASAKERLPATLADDFESQTRAAQGRIHGQHASDGLQVVGNQIENALRVDYPSRKLEVVITKSVHAPE